MNEDKLELLAQIASWYYEQNLTQEDIARRIGKSRSMVSRLLREAREEGIVEVRVRHPFLRRNATLESRLCQTFGLQSAWVLDNPPADYTLLLSRVGQLGARCLRSYLHDGMSIGVGWGTGVHAVVRAMGELPLQKAMVVQIIGAVGYGDPLIDGPELARWLAQKLDAAHRFLHAPLLVDNENLARALLQERAIAETLALARQVDMAIIGIGTVVRELSSLRRAGYLSQEDLLHLQTQGVVGDLLARQIDIRGRVLDLPLHRRIIGIDVPEDLARIPLVVAVAGGERKAPAILAALRSGLINALVTDAQAAVTVLNLHRG